MTKSLRVLSACACTLLSVGCSRNPNVEIVGSYFPGWMISLLAAVALTVIAHAFFRRHRLHHALGHPAIVYPGMVLMFTCLLWLSFFS